MISILERIEISLSFPAELSICGFLYVPEYILRLWLLRQIFIKSNGRSLWKAFTFQFFKRKELTAENQNSKALYISFAASVMQMELNHLLT